MPRRNHRLNSRTVQRSKALRLLEGAEQRTMRAVMAPRHDERERGAIDYLAALVMVLCATVVIVGMVLTLSAGPACAKAVQIEPASRAVDKVNPAIYVERLDGPRRWHYAELYDGSQWMVTPCKAEDSDNCWWNAKTRGNGKGRSFVVINDTVHYYRPAMQP